MSISADAVSLHPDTDALIVFAKTPRPGEVKTRLTPRLSEDEAARLYRAFLRDALVQYAALNVDVRLYLAPPHPPAAELSFVPEGVRLCTQAGDGLGARMRTAFAETLPEVARCCIIGTDHPTLPTAFLRLAYGALADEGPALCIGPSADGGYYLLGMNAFQPVVFEGMDYSHADVFADTLERARQTDARLTVLPGWYDVDTPPALRQLLDDLDTTGADLSATREVIDALNLRVRLDDVPRLEDDASPALPRTS